MPTDFKSWEQIINEDEVNGYIRQSIIKWEGRRDLYVAYEYNGNIRIVYRPVPTALTALTDTLQLDDVTALLVLPFGLAAQLMVHEDPNKANFFQQRYEALMAQETVKQPAGETIMADEYRLATWG